MEFLHLCTFKTPVSNLRRFKCKKIRKNVKSKVEITNENKEYYDLKATSFEEKIDYILNHQIYIKRYIWL